MEYPSQEKYIIRIFKKTFHGMNQLKARKKHCDAIGHLPSIESGETSPIKWHQGRKHTAEHILCMMHTPEGKSAYANKKFKPKTKNGKIPKGFKTTYARMKWDGHAQQ